MAFEIPVVFATNNDYVPYLGVAISSLITCSDDKYQYSIYILHTGITTGNQERLESLSTNNVIISCKDISIEMSDINIISSNHLTAETVYRILIPELFPQYEKVLYLDSDIIILKDVALLYMTELEGNVIGAVRDVATVYLQDHIKTLNIDFPIEEYFNAGVLIINTTLFLQMGINKKCFQMLNGTTKYFMLDNDALCINCRSYVKYIDEHWNFCWNYYSFKLKPLPVHEELYKQIATDPWIIHYASARKPWTHPDANFADIFWNYARNTPFNEEIIYKNTYKNVMQEIGTAFSSFVLPYTKIPFGSSIAIYGAGGVGKAFYRQIKITGLYKLSVWVDKNYERMQETGGEVYHPGVLKKRLYDFVLIAVENQSVANEITRTLISEGIERNKIVWTDPKIRTNWENWRVYE